MTPLALVGRRGNTLEGPQNDRRDSLSTGRTRRDDQLGPSGRGTHPAPLKTAAQVLNHTGDVVPHTTRYRRDSRCGQPWTGSSLVSQR